MQTSGVDKYVYDNGNHLLNKNKAFEKIVKMHQDKFELETLIDYYKLDETDLKISFHQIKNYMSVYWEIYIKIL